MKKTESKKLPKAGSDTPIAEISDTVSTESKKKTPSKSSAKSVRKTKKADTGIIKAPVKAIPVRVKIETFAAATPPKEERTSVNSKAEVSEEEKKSPAAGKKVLRKKGTGDSLRLAERISTSSEVAAHIAAAKGHMLRKVKLSKAKKTYYRDLLLAKRREFQQQLNIHRDDALISKKDTSIVEDAAPTAEKPFRALNLFAYTGAATCALAASGASVVHVDAAKGMVSWAKDNLASCELSSRPVRFLVDDAMKFVQREARRGNLYDGILMDPPSYGRGPGGEMWKIENDLYSLVEACVHILSPKARFFLINSYTTGLAPSVISNVMKVALKGHGGHVEVDELGLPIERDSLVLPCGATGRWTR